MGWTNAQCAEDSSTNNGGSNELRRILDGCNADGWNAAQLSLSYEKFRETKRSQSLDPGNYSRNFRLKSLISRGVGGVRMLWAFRFEAPSRYVERRLPWCRTVDDGDRSRANLGGVIDA